MVRGGEFREVSSRVSSIQRVPGNVSKPLCNVPAPTKFQHARIIKAFHEPSQCLDRVHSLDQSCVVSPDAKPVPRMQRVANSTISCSALTSASNNIGELSLFFATLLPQHHSPLPDPAQATVVPIVPMTTPHANAAPAPLLHHPRQAELLPLGLPNRCCCYHGVREPGA
ncbi:hypothetical protein NL676_020761 [Syzygium grande]|nr:hypothetical protein NL676_020761 [Syzygium grande]